jgi:CheY-like chemotaxis protein
VNGETGGGGLGVRTRERVDSPIADRGHLLLILTTRRVQSVAGLATASGQHPTDTVRSPGTVVDRGFIIVADQRGTAVYQLRRRAEPSSMSDLPQHILLVEDDLMIRELVMGLLEDEGDAVIVATVPVDAVALPDHVSCDLVITDGFSKVPGAVFANTREVLQRAGVTPVALFSAHTLDLEQAQEAGFRDLLPKPFDIATLLQQVRALLGR